MNNPINSPVNSDIKPLLSLSILLLWLLWLPISTTHAQDTPADNEKSETTETEETPAEETDATPVKPTRIPSDAPRKRYPAGESGQMAKLAEDLPEGSEYWLETPFGPFLSLWEADSSGDPKGALLIVHGEGEHLAWPTLAKPLIDTLPQYGWATLSISIPDPDPIKAPKRTLPAKVKPPPPAEEDTENTEQQATEEVADKEEATEENPEQTASEKVPEPAPPIPTAEEIERDAEDAELIAAKRLAAALEFLHEKGQYNVVLVGSGASAIRANRYVKSITPATKPGTGNALEKPFRALVIINASGWLVHSNHPSQDKTKAYGEWFNDPSLPVLDIFLGNNLESKSSAKQRKKIANRNKLALYQQVRLPIMSAEKSWGENRLSRRIRSFIETHAQGVEVRKRGAR